MRKKILLVTLIWFVIAIAIFSLYFFREVSPVREVIKWALDIWVILAAIITVGIAASTWVIKHDFKHKFEPPNSYRNPIPTTIGIDADESFINAPGVKITNQDIAIKGKKSIVNIPNSEIKDERRRNNEGS